MVGQSIQALIKFVDNTKLEGISTALKDRIRIQKIPRSWGNGVKKQGASLLNEMHVSMCKNNHVNKPTIGMRR